MNDIKLVCFDMDETLIKQNSWYKLNIALGVTPEEDKEMYDAYGSGDLSYADWITKLVTLYKERGIADRSRITKALVDYKLVDGATELMDGLHSKGYEIAIISGSFDVTVSHVADTLGVKHFKANTNLKFNQDDYLEEVVSDGDELHAKLRHLENLCDSLGISVNQCVCVGEGANNIELFNKSSKGITFKNSPELIRKAAWKVVDSIGDIEGLL